MNKREQGKPIKKARPALKVVSQWVYDPAAPNQRIPFVASEQSGIVKKCAELVALWDTGFEHRAVEK